MAPAPIFCTIAVVRLNDVAKLPETERLAITSNNEPVPFSRIATSRSPEREVAGVETVSAVPFIQTSESTTNREVLVFGPCTVAVMFGAASTTKVNPKELALRCIGEPVND